MAIGEDFDPKQLLTQLERLPAGARFGILAGVAAVIVGIYWFALFSGSRQQLARLQTQLTGIETQIVEAKAVAANLSSFKAKQEELKAELKEALRQLPNSSELPVLLTDINSLGKKTGLEIQKFKPTGEVSRGFYAEVPIQLRMFGRYHDVGVFFDRVSRLSRIVNVTELAMEISDDRGENPTLEVSGVARTFRFVDDDASAGGE